MKEPWDFVEKWFPNYFSSNIILRLDELKRIIDGEFEEESFIAILFKELYSSSIDSVKKDYYKRLTEIYEESIKNYIENGIH
jgi:hypothetical protein